MNPARRAFFRRAGLIAAAPTIGIAKVVGINPVMAAPAVFKNGAVLTAASLNDEFNKLHEAIQAIR